MARYTSTSRPNLLKFDDEVQFVSPEGIAYKHTVRNTHLNNDYDENDRILMDIGLSNRDDSPTGKYRFAGVAYGYAVNSGMWPCFACGDYAAATRMVNMIFDVLAGINTVEQIMGRSE